MNRSFAERRVAISCCPDAASQVRRFAFRIVLAALMMVASYQALSSAQQGGPAPTDPWHKSQVLMPEDLAKELSNSGGKKPLVVCVGFEFLYKGTHIAGSQFIGPGREAKGIEALKNWARGIPRDREVVLYCGCCPMKQCPNIRPAFQALRDMGLKRLKILYLERDLATDWLGKGLPTEKAQP